MCVCVRVCVFVCASVWMCTWRGERGSCVVCVFVCRRPWTLSRPLLGTAMVHAPHKRRQEQTAYQLNGINASLCLSRARAAGRCLIEKRYPQSQRTVQELTKTFQKPSLHEACRFLLLLLLFICFFVVVAFFLLHRVNQNGCIKAKSQPPSCLFFNFIF